MKVMPFKLVEESFREMVTILLNSFKEICVEIDKMIKKYHQTITNLENQIKGDTTTIKALKREANIVNQRMKLITLSPEVEKKRVYSSGQFPKIDSIDCSKSPSA